jgi:acetamidase/formamidase
VQSVRLTSTAGRVATTGQRVQVRGADFGFLNGEFGMQRATAYAYLSATSDFVVSQVVDKTKGVHALIRKAESSRDDSPSAVGARRSNP